MTIEQNNEDDVTALARRVERARGRLAYQFDPALTQALSEDELRSERELAERIRTEERGQRWKEVQAAAAASDRARQTTEAIEKADMRDLLLARKAIAAQRRESSPHAKLASLYRHRSWSLRALAGVVTAGMLWSAVNVQQNIAPGGPTDPLFWFSYLLEAMISACLIIIMIGTNKVAEWGVIDNRRQVLAAEAALLALTVSLNTYPYVRLGNWYDAAVHAVAPVMIGVALLIHDAVSARYGLAIARATAQVRDLPDATDQIRMRMPGAYRGSAITELGRPPIDEPAALPPMAEGEYEVVEEDELPPEDPDNDPDAAEQPDEDERTELTGGAEEAGSAFRSPNQPARQPVTAEAAAAEAEDEVAEEPKPAPKRTRPAAKVTKPAAKPQRAPAPEEVPADDAPTGIIPAVDPEADAPAAEPAKPAARKTAAKTARPAAKAAAKAVAAKAAPADEAAPAEEPKPAAKTAKPAAAKSATRVAAAAPKPAAVPEPVVEPAVVEPVARPAAARVAEPVAAPAAKPAATKAAQPAAAARAAQPAAAARAAQPAAAQAAQPAAARAAQPAAAARTAQPAVAARSAQPARVAQPAARAAGQGRSAAAAQPVSRQATARATAPVEVPEADRPNAPVISFASKAAARPAADRDPIMMPIEPTPSRPRSSGPRTGPLAAVGRKKKAPEPEPAPIPATSDVYDTGALRVADMLEQELAELREKRRQQRAAGRTSSRSASRDY